jgi:hypothetical protein
LTIPWRRTIPGRVARRRASGPGPSAVSLLLLLLVPPGCATLQGVLALRQVDFALDRVAAVRLAGVDLARIQRYEELSLLDAARVAQALSQGTLPLSMLLYVRADNPEGNPEARLLELDWILFLQDRETVGGGLPGAVTIPVAGSVLVPLEVRVDLLEFFQGSAQDLVNLALSLAGQDAPPTEIRLEATPTIETPLGPIRYPRPITIGTTR